MDFVFVAVQGSVVVAHQGVRIVLTEGETWAADDPFVKARPDLFASAPSLVRRTSPAGVVADRKVETAARVPGERRARRAGA